LLIERGCGINREFNKEAIVSCEFKEKITHDNKLKSQQQKSLKKKSLIRDIGAEMR
jgi:hypothetical protein